MNERLRGLEFGAIALVVAAPVLAWIFGAAAQLIDQRGFASLYTLQVVLWLILGGVALYYYRVLREAFGIVFDTRHAIVGALFILAALLLCGWEAALTASLGLSATIGFAWTWTLSVLRQIPCTPAGTKGIIVLGVLLPVSMLSLPVFAYCATHDWDALSVLAFAPALAIWIPAFVLSHKARAVALKSLRSGGIETHAVVRTES